MNKIIIILGILLLSTVLVLANENHQSEIEEGKKLVESKISCDKLNNEQLEAIGDYYMEQMHPGEAHELMHEMMGGHDSELTKNMHVNMANGIYCKENVSMMNMMDGDMMSSGMMSGGMMAGGNGMMGRYQNSYSPYNNYFNLTIILINILLIFLIIVIIIWFVKLLKNNGGKR